jgi:excisionase family DNA binding protein
MNENGGLMDIHGVARYLQFTEKTVYKMVQNGEIPAVKIRSEWRFPKVAIDQWLVKEAEKNVRTHAENK